jgi:WD40 repeat protein
MSSRRSRRANRKRAYPQYYQRLQSQIESHFPLFGGMFRLQAVKTLAEDAAGGSPNAARLLAKSLTSPDQQVCTIAQEAIRNISGKYWFNAVWEEWDDTRGKQLTDLLKDINRPASGPPQLHLISLLQLGLTEAAEKINADLLPILLKALRDRSEIIRQNAWKTLLCLKRAETQEAICQYIIDTEDDQAKGIASSAGYLPLTMEKRALYFFITEQWDRYENIDFDQRLMRVVYEVSTPELRQRIARKLQKAGRTGYISIMTGVDYHSPDADISQNEALSLIGLLSSNQEYTKLWDLVFELAAPQSLEIIKILVKAGWHPVEDVDRQTFSELRNQVQLPFIFRRQDLAKIIPMGIRKAKLRVSGRINDLSFSPSKPLIAIGTGNLKVVIWNYQTGKISTVVKGFNHSVGKVAYAPDGTLVCAERSRPSALCSLYGWNNGKPFLLGSHTGAVTQILPSLDSQLVSAGRDGKVCLWDLKNGGLLHSNSLEFWARASCIASQSQWCGLVEKRLHLLSLPELTIQREVTLLGGRNFTHAAPTCATTDSTGSALVLGRLDGQVILYEGVEKSRVIPGRSLLKHEGRVIGLQFLQMHDLLMSGGVDGEIVFSTWPDGSRYGSLDIDERLTSLFISRGGDFLATGTGEQTAVLWDLRPLDIPDLLSTPLVQATPNHVQLVNCLIEESSLPAPVINSLKFLHTLLLKKYQFDVQVDESTRIQPGEFDILVD